MYLIYEITDLSRNTMASWYPEIEWIAVAKDFYSPYTAGVGVMFGFNATADEITPCEISLRDIFEAERKNEIRRLKDCSSLEGAFFYIQKLSNGLEE